MFVFKPTVKTYSDPVAATFTPGIPFGREKSKGDICLLHTGFAASKIYLNSHVLREAILNSKDYLEEVLQLKITDRVVKEQPKKVDTKNAEVYVPTGEKIPKVDKDTIVESVAITDAVDVGPTRNEVLKERKKSTKTKK